MVKVGGGITGREETKYMGRILSRVLDKLWTEVRDIVQETGIKTIPKKKKCKEAKWLSEEALQITEKRREAKGKGEEERYIPFECRVPKNNTYIYKKAFLSDQCKELW